jgi:hypothetical protein
MRSLITTTNIHHYPQLGRVQTIGDKYCGGGNYAVECRLIDRVSVLSIVPIVPNLLPYSLLSVPTRLKQYRIMRTRWHEIGDRE